jgi:hypothetical protein
MLGEILTRLEKFQFFAQDFSQLTNEESFSTVILSSMTVLNSVVDPDPRGSASF